MNRAQLRCVLVCVLAVIVLTATVGLYLVISGQTASDDTGLVPQEEAWRAQHRGTHLEFIAETGRIVVNENGIREIIWDPPELPTLQESIIRGKVARLTGDSNLLPLCTEEYFRYLKAQKERRVPEDILRRLLPIGSSPACNAIPDRIIIGPPSGPGYPGRQNNS